MSEQPKRFTIRYNNDYTVEKVGYHVHPHFTGSVVEAAAYDALVAELAEWQAENRSVIPTGIQRRDTRIGELEADNTALRERIGQIEAERDYFKGVFETEAEMAGFLGEDVNTLTQERTDEE